MIRRIAFLAMIALPSSAQTGPEAEVLPRLIATGCFELVAAINGCEQVTLLESETAPDSADLLIYPDRRTDEAAGPLLIARGVAFNGAMWGMSPALESMPGGFRLSAEQSGIGRYPWFESIDIAHDGNDFVVTRYSYSAYDRALPRSLICEVDMISGAYRYEIERGDPENETAAPEIITAAGAETARIVPLREWRSVSSAPARCAAAHETAFASD